MRAVTKRPFTTKVTGVIAALVVGWSPAAAQAAPTRQAPAQRPASAAPWAAASTANPCVLDFHALKGSDLRRVIVRSAGSPPRATMSDSPERADVRFVGADPARDIRATGAVDNTWDDTIGKESDNPLPNQWRTIALRGTSLVAMFWEQDLPPRGHYVFDRHGSHQRTDVTVLGRGWGAFTQLIDSPDRAEFYAFAPRLKGGSLNRYRHTATGVKSAGAVTGFGDLKGITMISSQPARTSCSPTPPRGDCSPSPSPERPG